MSELPLSPPARGMSRAAQGPAAQLLISGPLELRLGEYQALARGVRVGLTVREFQVLLALAEQEDRVVRRAAIYARVWGGDMKRRDRSVDVFVRKVRGKLSAASPEWEYIHTHFGIGYRFAPVPSVVQPSQAPGQTSRTATA